MGDAVGVHANRGSWWLELWALGEMQLEGLARHWQRSPSGEAVPQVVIGFLPTLY
jgi:hypothetical protein